MVSHFYALIFSAYLQALVSAVRYFVLAEWPVMFQILWLEYLKYKILVV